MNKNELNSKNNNNNNNQPEIPSPILSQECLEVIERLRNHKPPIDNYHSQRASVMVALFASKDGSRLNVLLTTRSLSMRTYAGNVALPGGKKDEEDLDLITTARREAFEEVGLPMDPEKVEFLTCLRPFPSRSMLLVTPVICLIKDYSIQPVLNPTEVDQVFSFPLHAFLLHQAPPEIFKNVTPSVIKGTIPYHTSYDYGWYGGNLHRFHNFETLPVPITGLTASILIEVALTAFGRNPDYAHQAPDELEPEVLIAAALKDPKWYKKADEGLVATARAKAKIALLEKEQKKAVAKMGKL